VIDGITRPYYSGDDCGAIVLPKYKMPPGRLPPQAASCKRGSRIVARIYPVASQAESFFIAADGVTRTTIRLNIADWQRVSVTAGGGRAISGAWQRNAYEFVTTPGETYELR
jgi:hypothetical protein